MANLSKHHGFAQSFRRSRAFWLTGFVTLSIVAAAPAIATVSPVSFAAQSSPSSQGLLKQGQQRYQAGQFAEAVEIWQKAAKDYQTRGDRNNQALSLGYLSLAYQALGNLKNAEISVKEALDLIKTQPKLDARGAAIQAQLFNIQGKLLLFQGKAETALETWQTAEKAYTRLKDPTGILGSQLNQVQALQALGLYRRAQDSLEKINKQLNSQPDSPLKLTALQSLGQVWQGSGNLKEAQKVLEQSLTIARQLKQPSEISSSLLNLGNISYKLQEKDNALQSYQQAAEIAPTVLDRLEAQVNQFRVLVGAQRWKDAQALLTQIQPQLDQLSASRASVYLRVNLAINLMDSRWATADTQKPAPTLISSILSTAVQQARQLGDARAESAALGQMGELYERSQQWKDAQTLTQYALSIAETINASDLAYRWQWQLGRLRKQQNDRSGAIAAYSESVNLLKSLRRDLVAVNPEIQFSFQEKVEPVYRELVSLLVQDTPSQTELKQAREVLESLQQAELENFFRVACLNARPIQIDTVDKSAAVLYPIILPDRLAVIVSAPGQPLQVHSSPIARKQLEDLLDKTLESFNPLYSDQERLQLSQKFYDWLIRPVESTITNSKASTLVFVLDGGLRHLPISALHDGQQYLIEKYNVALAPGLHLLESTASVRQPEAKVLLGGLTEARQGFSALPGVSQEAQAVKEKAQASVFLNETFTTKNLEGRIRSDTYPVVHFATHGQFSSNLDNTFLLTWNERVNIEELRTMLKNQSELGRKPIELLILSACETAAGDNRAILGLAGIAVRSGARTTIATLWAVNDAATAEAMVQFYQELSKQDFTKAGALRQAQLKLLRNPEYSHPYYWAPFVLIGNWW
jgi:CHAT domain-containing protein/tetratricopeptide (TPR) repeat protein